VLSAAVAAQVGSRCLEENVSAVTREETSHGGNKVVTTCPRSIALREVGTPVSVSYGRSRQEWQRRTIVPACAGLQCRKLV
jgi:hypothetical protein